MAIRLRGARISISSPAQAASDPEAYGQIRPLPWPFAPSPPAAAGYFRDRTIQRQFAQHDETGQSIAWNRAERRHQASAIGRS
jgi:hypothetical protein